MSISAVDTSPHSSANPETDSYYEDRVNLAAALRMAARLNLHESVANHFSYAVSADGGRFLINPFGRHFSTLRASELLLLDAHDDSSIDAANRPDPTAWAIHSAMHRNAPQARCVLHAHSKYATVLASIEADGLQVRPILETDQLRVLEVAPAQALARRQWK